MSGCCFEKKQVIGGLRRPTPLRSERWETHHLFLLLSFFTCEVENKNSNLERGNVLGFKKITEAKAPWNLLVWPPLVTSK